MLNPEYVDDVGHGNVKIGFTDGEGDQALEIQLKKEDASDLHKMLLKRVQEMNGWPPKQRHGDLRV